MPGKSGRYYTPGKARVPLWFPVDYLLPWSPLLLTPPLPFGPVPAGANSAARRGAVATYAAEPPRRASREGMSSSADEMLDHSKPLLANAVGPSPTASYTDVPSKPVRPRGLTAGAMRRMMGMSEPRMGDAENESFHSMPRMARRPLGGAGATSSARQTRVLDRDGAFHQSKGVWNIQRRSTGAAWATLYAEDWFHTVLNSPTRRIVVGLLVIFLVLVFAWGLVYRAVAQHEGCALEFDAPLQAYYFSLETMTTIGYGTKDYFFGDCWSMFFAISAQMLSSIMFDSLCIGIIFARLSRGQKRANTIVFSRNAVFRRHNGKTYFLFQVCELRKHQLVEAHVRCYAVRHHRDVALSASHGPGAAADREAGPKVVCDTTFFQSYLMRLQHPDDELGAALLLSLPSVVAHRVDQWSPLLPPTVWMSRTGLVDTSRLPFGEAARRRRRRHKGSFFSSGSRREGAAAFAEESNCTSAPPPKTPPSAHSDAGAREDAASGLRRRFAAAPPAGSPLEGGPAAFLRRDYRFPQLLRRAADDTDDEQEDNLQYRDLQYRARAEVWGGREGAAAEEEKGGGAEGGVPHLRRAPSGRSEVLYDLERAALTEFMEDRELEIVVLVEGIDALTSCTLQARHSYRWEEIVWDHTFERCVHRGPDGTCVIDFDDFHKLVPSAPCNDSFGPVGSHA